MVDKLNSQPLLLSVVIPVNNEAAQIESLAREVQQALDGVAAYELIYVDDGSSDRTLEILRRLKQQGTMPLRILHHHQALGQSTAVHDGMLAAQGAWVVTLDGDGQNIPADIPALLQRVQSEPQLVMVIGHRVDRSDTRLKKLASRFANGLRSWLLKDKIPDTGCGLKIVRRDVFLQLPYFDHMHRYMPALVQSFGYATASHPVQHRERSSGKSHYGIIDRGLAGLLDLFGVSWLIHRNRKQLPVEEIE